MEKSPSGAGKRVKGSRVTWVDSIRPVWTGQLSCHQAWIQGAELVHLPHLWTAGAPEGASSAELMLQVLHDTGQQQDIKMSPLVRI